MSSGDRWECLECHALLQAHRTAARHWRDAQAAGKGHQGGYRIAFRPGAPVPAPVLVLAPAPAAAVPPPPSLPLPPAPTPTPLPLSFPLPAPSPFSFSSPFSPVLPDSRADDLPQLRSSRSTRNQDHQAASRNRPGVVDLDPTEGLPVQKWEQVPVKINQDPSIEPASTSTLPSGTTATSSAEWAAQFNTPQYPWPERPLPSFFGQLTPWNQEMIRRARAGNTNAKLSVWDRKSNSWISSAEAEKRRDPLKSAHLNNQDPNTGSKQNTAPDSPTHDDDDDHDEKSDEEADGDNGDGDVGATTAQGLKRRKKFAPEERMIEVKRWTQMPSAIADKTEERKFLADRRPGMPSLYGGTYQNEIFGSMGLNTNGYGFSAANAGYDLGDGGGLGNTGTMLQPNDAPATPVRKNMPPKRKKKKGGPGRKKANPNPVPQPEASGDQHTALGEQTLDGTRDQKPVDITMADGDNDGSDSGSEAEGSEEGEIDEGGHDNEKHVDQTEKKPEAQAKVEAEQQSAVMNGHEIIEEPEIAPTIVTGAETVQVTSDITMQEADVQTNPATTDVPMQMEPALQETTTSISEPIAAEDAPVPEPQPELISSMTQLPAPEQPSELPAPDPVPLQASEAIPEVTLEVPETTEQPIPVPAEPSSLPVASLDAVPVEPTTQLPPISTAVAEAIDQPSTSAPGTESVSAPEVPKPEQPPVPEPTSPDLLGGLEDELNKNMGEQNSDQT